MQVKLRSLEESDAEASCALLHELGYATTRDMVTRQLERIRASSELCALVAEVDGRVVGLATGHVLPVIHEEHPLAMLTALVVNDSVRGTGIGRRLVAAIEAWARHEGAHRIVVTSGLARTDAHAFYERIGYEHTARRFSRSL